MSLIKYLAVFRIKPSLVIVARNSHDSKVVDLEDKCRKVASKILALNKEKKLWSFESKNEGYTIHTCVKPVENEDLVFFAITTLKFPHNPASVFKEFVTKFVRTISVKDIDAAEDDGLTYSAQSVFKAVDQKYGVDKLKDTQAKVDGLKNQLHNNMQDLLERGEQLDEIQMNADQLDQDAKGFKATATDLKWKFCCLNAKWTILLTLFLITIITVIVVAAVCTSDPDACKQK